MTEARLPRRFGAYALFDFVGKGGMAEIYLARHTTELGAARQCVVKVILPELAGRKEFADMLVAEAKLAARLSHANVVQVFDLGREDGQLFIAMEYVEGFDLAQLLRSCSRQKVGLPPEYALHIVLEALRGLDYAHRLADDGEPLGLVHRDVSPSNVLVSFDGEVKVCDFGIARANALAGGAVEGAEEAIKGKAGYMSPEQARGDAVDARSDVFAAGIVLWELVQGRRMYKVEGDKRPEALLELARAADVPELVARGLPEEEELFAIVRRALAKDPAERFPSAGAMHRELEAWVQKAKLGASQIKLGAWLLEHFGQEVIDRRRARERAVRALEKGPAAVVTPIAAEPVKDADEPARAKPEKEISARSLPPESLVGAAMDVEASAPHPAAPPAPARWPLVLAGLAIAAVVVAAILAGR